MTRMYSLFLLLPLGDSAERVFIIYFGQFRERFPDDALDFLKFERDDLISLSYFAHEETDIGQESEDGIELESKISWFLWLEFKKFFFLPCASTEWFTPCGYFLFAATILVIFAKTVYLWYFSNTILYWLVKWKKCMKHKLRKLYYSKMFYSKYLYSNHFTVNPSNHMAFRTYFPLKTFYSYLYSFIHIYTHT